MIHPSFTRQGIIANEAPTAWYEGAGILESAMAIKASFADHDWFGVGANGITVGLSGLGAILDPFQVVAAAGVGCLMEHLSILRQPLDWLAGDSKEIEGQAESWRNIGERVFGAAEYYASEVERASAAWTSQATDAYRTKARQHVETMRAIGEISDVLAEITLIAGGVIAVVRNTIRDLVADVVGAAVSKALQAMSVVLVPKVLAEVSLLVVDCSSKITTLLRRLFDMIRALSSKLQVAAGG